MTVHFAGPAKSLFSNSLERLKSWVFSRHESKADMPQVFRPLQEFQPADRLEEFYGALVSELLFPSGAKKNRAGADFVRSTQQAIRRFSSALKEDAQIRDLTWANFLMFDREEAQRGTAFNYRRKLISRLRTVAVHAVEMELLSELPRLGYAARAESLTSVELTRLLHAARSCSREVFGIPGRDWWPAFILLMVDCGVQQSELLELPREAYDSASGKLTIGPVLHQLHPLSRAALDGIAPLGRELLLPWEYDHNGNWQSLSAQFKKILGRAGLSSAYAPIQRLRVTSNDRSILDAVDLSSALVIPVQADDGRVYTAPISSSANDLVTLKISSRESLLEFFRNTYVPIRLSDSSENTIGKYWTTLRLFEAFLACEPTVLSLNDETVEQFLVWTKKRGATNGGAVSHRTMLLAIWRFAWKKRKVAELPRDIQKFVIEKKIPEAWSLDEVQRILESAQMEQGTIGGVPAGQFWTALLLVLYYTGLRIEATLLLESSSLNLTSGWLAVPAAIQKQRADQLFALPEDALAALALTQPQLRSRLFPSPWKEMNPLRKRLRRILNRAGLPSSFRDLFHKFRRTSATLVCDALGEAAAQRHLGHSSLSVTRRYIDPRKLEKSIQTPQSLPTPKWGK